ncbi:MAG: hypothetical protein RI637_10410 [Acidimicrobiia bacterium]|nr:hypothetical protein [Acidimicrobiia bacterium]
MIIDLDLRAGFKPDAGFQSEVRGAGSAPGRHQDLVVPGQHRDEYGKAFS